MRPIVVALALLLLACSHPPSDDAPVAVETVQRAVGTCPNGSVPPAGGFICDGLSICPAGFMCLWQDINQGGECIAFPNPIPTHGFYYGWPNITTLCMNDWASSMQAADVCSTVYTDANYSGWRMTQCSNGSPFNLWSPFHDSITAVTVCSQSQLGGDPLRCPLP